VLSTPLTESVVRPTGTFSATLTAPSTPDLAVLPTGGVETPQPTVVLDVCPAATTAPRPPLLRRPLLLSLQLVPLLPEMMVAVVRTLVTLPVMPTALTADAVLLTGKFVFDINI
jgi:hypothetical protein